MTPRYETAFVQECNRLSIMIVGSLQKLAINPKDKAELQKLVQSADTVMGNARFLNDKELEKNATMVVKSFNNIHDVRKKIDEYHVAFEQFGRIAAKIGACPKGYALVDGKCILKNDSRIISNAT